MSDNAETSSSEVQTPEVTQPIKLQTGVTLDSYDIGKDIIVLNENKE